VKRGDDDIFGERQNDDGWGYNSPP